MTLASRSLCGCVGRWSATLFVLALLCLGCRSNDGINRARKMDLAKVPGTLAEAQAVLAQGDAAPLEDLSKAVAGLRSARVTPGVDSATQTAVQAALEQGADDLIRRGTKPKPLKQLIESELPMRLAARAGVRAAELQLDKGARMEAFKTLRALDKRYPTHTQRDVAGNLLARIGNSLAEDRGRYFLVFRYASLAPEVLEYLALEYPTHPETDDALARLAGIYERRRNWEEAIAKHQALVLWAPNSPYRAASEAAIPHLRLASSDRPDYARDTLVLAHDELTRWLAAHPDGEGHAAVERDLVDARQRLADNDLITARFYATVGSRAGVRFHALRAESVARLAGNVEQVEEAQALLAKALTIPARVEVEETGEKPLEENSGTRDILSGSPGLSSDGDGR